MHIDNRATRYILYARKSNEDSSKQIQSIETQLNEMRGLAKQHGIKIVKTLTEEKSARYPGKRPQFNEMIRMIEAKEADGILTWTESRLARNPQEGGLLRQYLIDKKIREIVTATSRYRPEDHTLLLALQDAMNAQFSISLSKEVAAGMLTKVRNGGYPHQAPVGYRNDKDTSLIAIDEERFDQVRGAWDLLLTGRYTISSLYRIMVNDWKMTYRPSKKRPSRPLTQSAVYAMFRNPFYMGKIPYKGEVLQGKHKPMVTEVEFLSVQHFISRKVKYQLRKAASLDAFDMRGLIKCGECGCSITYGARTKLYKNGNSQTFEYCYCTRRSKLRTCTQRRSLRKPVLDDMILHELASITIPKPFYDWAVNEIETMAKETDKSWLVVRNGLEKALENNRQMQDNLLYLHLQGGIDVETFKSESKTLKLESIDITAKITGQEKKRLVWGDTMKTILNISEYATREFKNGTAEKRRKIVSLVSRNLELIDNQLLLHPVPGLDKVKSAANRGLFDNRNVETYSSKGKNAPLGDVLSQWYTWQDLNLRPLPPQGSALSS